MLTHWATFASGWRPTVGIISPKAYAAGQHSRPSQLVKTLDLHISKPPIKASLPSMRHSFSWWAQKRTISSEPPYKAWRLSLEAFTRLLLVRVKFWKLEARLERISFPLGAWSGCLNTLMLGCRAS